MEIHMYMAWDKTLPFYQLLLCLFQISIFCMVNVGFPVFFWGFLEGNSEIKVFKCLSHGKKYGFASFLANNSMVALTKKRWELVRNLGIQAF